MQGYRNYFNTEEEKSFIEGICVGTTFRLTYNLLEQYDYLDQQEQFVQLSIAKSVVMLGAYMFFNGNNFNKMVHFGLGDQVGASAGRILSLMYKPSGNPILDIQNDEIDESYYNQPSP